MNIKFAFSALVLEFTIASVTAMLCSIFSAAAHAQALPAYPISAVASTTAWGPDRYAPAAFVNAGSLFGRDNVLRIGIAAADADGVRPPAFAGIFYNTQGRKILRTDLNSGVSWSGSVYIPASWATSNVGDALLNRRTDVWATVSPAMGGSTCPASNCNLFPIIGFTNASVATPVTNGGTPRFRVFDANAGGWNDLATAINYDTWTELGITYTGTAIEHRINDVLVYTQTNLTQSDNTFGPPARIGDIFFQGYNFGTTYDIYWSRAAAGAGTVAAVVAAAIAPPPAAIVPLTVTPIIASNGFSSAGTIFPNTPFIVDSGTQARINVSTQFRYIAKVSGTCPARLVGTVPLVPNGSGNTQLVTDALQGSCTAIVTFVPTIPKVAVFSPAAAPSAAPQNAMLTFKAVITDATNADGTVAFFVDGLPIGSCAAQAIVQKFFANDEQERAATCTTTFSAFNVGEHFVTAQYSGNTHNFPAGSPALSYRVQLPKFSVTPVLVAAPNGAIGTITPNTVQLIEINKFAEFKVSAPAKHTASTVGSTCPSLIESSTPLVPQGAGETIAYTEAITKDCTVRISFVPIQPVLTVTAAATAKVGTPTQISAGVTSGASASGVIAFYENDVIIPACAAQPIITTFTVDLSVRTATCAWLPTQSGARNISARYAGDTFNFGAQGNTVVVAVAP